MSTLFQIVAAIAAGMILWRTIGVMATVDFRRFQGHPVRFVALSLHWALVAAGAVAIAACAWQAGALMIVVGLAIMVVADHRKAHG